MSLPGTCNARLIITDLKTAPARCHPVNARVENPPPPMHTAAMPITLDQIVAEARQLPREQSAELIDFLLAATVAAPDAEIEQA